MSGSSRCTCHRVSWSRIKGKPACSRIDLNDRVGRYSSEIGTGWVNEHPSGSVRGGTRHLVSTPPRPTAKAAASRSQSPHPSPIESDRKSCWDKRASPLLFYAESFGTNGVVCCSALSVTGSGLYQSISRVKYIADATAKKLAIAPTSSALSSSRSSR